MKKERIALTLDTEFSSMDDLPGWLHYIKDNFKFYGKPKHEEKWLNVPCAFDIETTNYYNEAGEKRATMYIWMVSIFGKAFYGRTWCEFQSFLDTVARILETDSQHRIVFFIHNASFEFAFLQGLFEWEKVFATEVHKVVYAYTSSGIEFRCSLFLYGASLDHLGRKGLTRYHVEKASGDLDYSLIRHSGTVLTKQELHYCLNDVQVVCAYIEEKIQDDKRLCFVPLTKTGFPRRLIKKRMLHGSNSWDTRKLLENLTYELHEFLLTRWMYAGGFTHTAHDKVGKVWYDVASQDFTSSYPYCLLLPIYPISKGEKIEIRDESHFRRNMENFCCLMHLKLYGVKESFGYEHILSASKCKNLVNAKVDNGRIISCDYCEVAFNEIDFEMFEKFYSYERMEIVEFYRYRRGYLPKEFVETIIELYWKKCIYKYDIEMIIEYMLAKGNLNAMYGVCVTNPLQNSITFTRNDGWKRSIVNYEEELEKYNAKKSRFIYYGWGCWCTSAGRKHLQDAILQLKEDYIYSDTDSVKYLHKEKHDPMFEEYNKQVVINLQNMCKFFKIKFEMVSPDGLTIGVFDYEGKYRRFKALGAKRYMVQYHNTGEISITVAGLNKKTAVPWMEVNFEDPFEAFTDDLYVPEGYAGKMKHTYCDYGFSEFLTDYQGNTRAVSEQSYVHLEETHYTLNIAEEFKEYVNMYTKGISA